MLNILGACFSKFPAIKRLHFYRDETISKNPSSPSKIQTRTHDHKNFNQLETPLLHQSNNDMPCSYGHGYGYGYGHSSLVEKKRVIIKVLMTKEEAARLLSKCKDQKGRLQRTDVAKVLAGIPSNRVNPVSTSRTSHGMMLGSIPEEDSSPINGAV